MRIERIREERSGEWHRVSADAIWEDRDAPVQTLTIEAQLPFGRELEPSSDAFLVALLPLAQWHGERRIRVEGRVCTTLRDGLATVMHLFARWYPRCRPLAVEPTQGFAPTLPRREPRAASFLSGGIDALSLLRQNRLDYPVTHPSFIRDSILIFGLNSFDAGPDGPNTERLLAFESHVRRMTPFAEKAGLTLMPMRTNIRPLYPDFPTWSAVGLAAGLVSTALCMSARIDRVELGSTGLGLDHPPLGSHPLLDHHYSTGAVAVRQAQSALTRFEKTRIVAEWDDALSVLRSCLYVRIPEPGRINCGECEKCLRTMLALVALGKLDRAASFPHKDVTASMLGPVLIESQINVQFYTQVIEALAGRRRDDLAVPLRRKIDAYRRRERRRRVRALVRRVTGL